MGLLCRILLVMWTTLAPAAFLFADDKPKGQTIESMVRMQDGTELATTVYLPEGSGPFPTVVARTPYNKDGLKGDAAKFVRQSYAFVGQDLRGRFKSKGHHAIIFHNDGWQT